MTDSTDEKREVSFALRLPGGVYEAIVAAAGDDRRSINLEMVYLLELGLRIRALRLERDARQEARMVEDETSPGA